MQMYRIDMYTETGKEAVDVTSRISDRHIYTTMCKTDG